MKILKKLVLDGVGGKSMIVRVFAYGSLKLVWYYGRSPALLAVGLAASGVQAAMLGKVIHTA
jgi:hypothetical protein